MALTIDGKSRKDIGRESFIALGAAVGLRERAIIRLLEDLCAAVDGWKDQLTELPFDEPRLAKLRRSVEYRQAKLMATNY
jgi:hypothetical protein